jgi:hypothetical protein
MMRASAGSLALLLLAGCSGPAASPPLDNVAVPDARPLAGTWYEWPPAGDRDQGDIILRVDGRHMVANSDCATMAWTYRLSEQRLEIQRAPVSSCVRGLTPREERFRQTLDTATRASRDGGNLIIASPKGRLVLHDRPRERS